MFLTKASFYSRSLENMKSERNKKSALKASITDASTKDSPVLWTSNYCTIPKFC